MGVRVTGMSKPRRLPGNRPAVSPWPTRLMMLWAGGGVLCCLAQGSVEGVIAAVPMVLLAVLWMASGSDA